jgi:hypothetical protein
MHEVRELVFFFQKWLSKDFSLLGCALLLGE